LIAITSPAAISPNPINRAAVRLRAWSVKPGFVVIWTPREHRDGRMTE
jgi:hypothetical protein